MAHISEAVFLALKLPVIPKLGTVRPYNAINKVLKHLGAARSSVKPATVYSLKSLTTHMQKYDVMSNQPPPQVK